MATSCNLAKAIVALGGNTGTGILHLTVKLLENEYFAIRAFLPGTCVLTPLTNREVTIKLPHMQETYIATYLLSAPKDWVDAVRSNWVDVIDTPTLNCGSPLDYHSTKVTMISGARDNLTRLLLEQYCVRNGLTFLDVSAVDRFNVLIPLVAGGSVVSTKHWGVYVIRGIGQLVHFAVPEVGDCIALSCVALISRTRRMLAIENASMVCAIHKPYQKGEWHYTLITDSFPDFHNARQRKAIEQLGWALNMTSTSNNARLHSAYHNAAEAASARMGGHYQKELLTDSITTGHGLEDMIDTQAETLEPGFIGARGKKEVIRDGVAVETIKFTHPQPSLAGVSTYLLRSLATTIPQGYDKSWSHNAFDIHIMNRLQHKLFAPEPGMLVSGGRIDHETPYNVRNEVTGQDMAIQVQSQQYVWTMDCDTVNWKLTHDYRFAAPMDTLRDFAESITSADVSKRTIEDIATVLSISRAVNVKVLATKPAQDINGVRLESIASLAMWARYASYTRMATRAWLYALATAIVEKFSAWGEDFDAYGPWKADGKSKGTVDMEMPEKWACHPVFMAGPPSVGYEADKIRARPYLPTAYNKNNSMKIYGLAARPVKGKRADGTEFDVTWGPGFANAGEPIGEESLWRELFTNGGSGFTDGTSQMLDVSGMNELQIQMLMHCLEDGATAYRISLSILRTDANYKSSWVRKLFGMDMNMPGARKIYLHFGTKQLQMINEAWPLKEAIGLTRPTWDGLPHHKFSFEAWRNTITMAASRFEAEACFTMAYEMASLYTFGYVLNNWTGKSRLGSVDYNVKNPTYAHDQFACASLKDNVQNTVSIRGWWPLGTPTIPADLTLVEYFRANMTRMALVGPLARMSSFDRDTIFEHSRLLNHGLAYARTTAHIALGVTVKRAHAWNNKQYSSQDYIWMQHALERAVTSRSESMLDATTMSIMAHAFGFAPTTLTATHIDYNMTHETGITDAEKLVSPEFVLIWNWPYSDLHLFDAIPEVWILPTRDTRPTWPEGYEKPVPNSVQGMNYAMLTDSMNPMDFNMWMNDGGMTYDAQHFLCCDAQGEISGELFSDYELLRRPHPYQNERRRADQVVNNIIRLPAPLGNYLQPGVIMSFEYDGGNSNTWAYAVAIKDGVPTRRVDWTEMVFGNNPRSFARRTLECRRRRVDAKVQSRNVEFAYATLVSKLTKRPITYTALRFVGGRATTKMDSGAMNSKSQMPSFYANVEVPGLMTAVQNAYNAHVWQKGGVSIISKHSKQGAAALRRANDTLKATGANSDSEQMRQRSNVRSGNVGLTHVTKFSEPDRQSRALDHLKGKTSSGGRSEGKEQERQAEPTYLRRSEITDAMLKNIGTNPIVVLPDLPVGLYKYKKDNKDDIAQVERVVGTPNRAQPTSVRSESHRAPRFIPPSADQLVDEHNEVDLDVKQAAVLNRKWGQAMDKAAHEATDNEANRVQHELLSDILDEPKDGSEPSYIEKINEQETKWNDSDNMRTGMQQLLPTQRTNTQGSIMDYDVGALNIKDAGQLMKEVTKRRMPDKHVMMVN